MALNWKTVTADHVNAALAQLSASKPTNRSFGLVVHGSGRVLAAKEVLGLAYRLANHLPQGVKLKFSSGDGTLNVLKALGFKAERIDKLKS